jgi:hypothetical protein
MRRFEKTGLFGTATKSLKVGVMAKPRTVKRDK